MDNSKAIQNKYEVLSKMDRDLSKNDILSIFHVYNECFYEGNIRKRDQIETAKKWISKFNTFQWYFIKVDGRIVAIGNFVVSYVHSKEFAFNTEKGENVTSIGVLPKFRRVGLAKLIVEKIIEEHSQVVDLVVEIKKANPLKEAILSMYRNLGFHSDVGEDEENLYVMRKIERNG